MTVILEDQQGEVVKLRLRDLPFETVNIPRFVLLGLIRGSQKANSPALSADTSKFCPSYFHYGYQQSTNSPR